MPAAPGRTGTAPGSHRDSLGLKPIPAFMVTGMMPDQAPLHLHPQKAFPSAPGYPSSTSQQGPFPHPTSPSPWERGGVFASHGNIPFSRGIQERSLFPGANFPQEGPKRRKTGRNWVCFPLGFPRVRQKWLEWSGKEINFHIPELKLLELGEKKPWISP